MTEFHPLSCVQELMIGYSAEFGYGTSTWNEQIVMHLDDLDDDHVRAVLRHIDSRHGVLRTRLGLRNGRHCQAVHDPTERLPHRLVRGDVETVTRNERSTPFDLLSGPLWRSATVPRSDGAGTVVLTLNHLVSDRQSDYMLASEFIELYERAGTGLTDERPASQYFEFARWQRTQVAHFCKDPSSLANWSNYELLVRSMRPKKRRPADDQPNLAGGSHGPRRECRLSFGISDTDHLAAFARSCKTTLNSVFTTALAIATSRLSDLHIGLILGERSIRYPHRFSETLGPFPDPWPIWNDADGPPTFAAALSTVRERTLHAVDAPVPFHLLMSRIPWLAKEIRSAGSNTMVFYQYFGDSALPTARYARADAVDFPISFGDHSDMFGIHLIMGLQHGSLSGRLAYQPHKISRAGLANIADEIQDVLRQECGHPIHLDMEDVPAITVAR